MRTLEQIENLRKVFCMMYTPLARFWSDEDVDFLADHIQMGINEHAEWTWEIRVLTKLSSEHSWENIKPEPKTPYCTTQMIRKKCNELIEKYPNIISILVIAKENSKLLFEFPS